MKILSCCFRLPVIFLVLASCNNNAGLADKAADDSNKQAASAAAKKTSCCFMNPADGQRFFPAASGSISPVDTTEAFADLYCSEEGDSPSSFTKAYKSGEGRMSLRISDFCINPHRAETDYEKRKKVTVDSYNADRELRDLADGHGNYKGFAVFSPSGKSAYLHVIVDGRFSITIAGISQHSIDDVISLFKMVPLDQLAGFGR
ncbi:MAG: hypothetical protein IPP93_13800 [Chitinophagaceae bacterium]|nr:hypothetical protein [Chitinophagaceae bacterium]